MVTNTARPAASSVTTAVCGVCGWEADELIHCGCCQVDICSECYVEKGHLQKDPAPDAEWAAVRGDTKVTSRPRPSPPAVTTAVPIVLPDDVALNGWTLHPDPNGLDGWFVASHPAHGQTSGSYLFGNRPDLSILSLVKQIRRMAPSGGLTPTSISQTLTTINDAFADLEAQAQRLEHEIETYDRNRCNGRPYHRTANSGTVFLYAHHTAGLACPTCGEHPDGKRLRKYIGEEQTAVADNAHIAMRYQTAWEKARVELDRVKQRLQRVNRLVWQLQGETAVVTNR